MEDIIANLKSFTRSKKKVHFICACQDEIIHNIGQLLYNFLHGKFKVKKSKSTHKQLFNIRYYIRKLANKQISVRNKRKILVEVGVRTILFKIIQENLLPGLVKSMKK